MGKKLAIKGHPTRGKEVIELLKMMGGTNPFSNNGELLGNKETCYYYISKNVPNKYIFWNYIDPEEIDKYQFFTLEEFLEKCPFKVGDVIKFPNNMAEEIAEMKWDEELEDIIYTSVSGWTRPCSVPKNTNNKANMNMNENKVESTGFMQMGKTISVIFNSANYEDEVELQLDDYEIEVRNGKTYAVRKKLTYPKTYNECYSILNDFNFPNPEKYDFEFDWRCKINDKDYGKLMQSFIKLFICRNAYWKIAGVQMGLDKPWDIEYGCGEWGYWVGYDVNENRIYCQDSRILLNHLLVFPTEEMRDAFFENFKDLIEQCKEFL